ncbi:MAG: glycosyl transferase family 2, partial [Bacteroidales bacterium]|nr:glycosyl transferase family 2 [Bacteroidales bacterium]
LPPLWMVPSRYEAELLLLVLSAWKGVRIDSVPIRICYPEDRVSHFRPHADFARISVLNVILCLLAVVYGYPRLLMRKIVKR